jgi:hypothetical protein
MRNIQNKEEFEEFVRQGLSSNDIAKAIGKSQTSVRHWLRKFNLETKPTYSLSNRYKFSDEEIKVAWEKSDSINSFLKEIGVNKSGGSFYHYKKRLLKMGFDPTLKTEWRKKGAKISAEKSNAKSLNRKVRLPRTQLKKAMDLAEISYECNICGIFEWRGVKIKLHIHHRDHDKTNNAKENLEYLCPNCHGIQHYEEK